MLLCGISMTVHTIFKVRVLSLANEEDIDNEDYWNVYEH